MSTYARESSLDAQIHARVVARKGYHVKYNANECTKKGIPDHFISYKGHFICLEAKTGSAFGPLQRKQLRLIQATDSIAEVCYDANLVNKIFDCIDRGETWTNGDYYEDVWRDR